MTPFRIVRWLKSLCRPAQANPHKHKNRLRLRLEELEDRVTPSTHIWTGAGGTSSWKNPANWNGGAPTGALDTDGQYPALVFPAGVPSFTNNDLPDPSVGVLPTFKSITISGNNYTLTGNPIILGDPNASLSSALTVNNNTLNAVIDLAIELGGPATGTNEQFFTVGGGSMLTLDANAPLSSASTNPQLTKEGSGTLVLQADDSAFTGPITLDLNGGIVNIQNANALGTNNAVSVDTNSQLQIDLANGGTITNFQKLTLNGLGVANNGAVLNVSPAGTNTTWNGPVVLDSSPSPNGGIYFGANTGTSLNFSGVISDLGAGQGLSKEGPGTIVFSNDNTYRGQTTIDDGILQIETPRGLGTSAGGTLVNQNNFESGQLQLNFNAAASPYANGAEVGGILEDYLLPWNAATNPYIGFVVMDEMLTLNGFGGNSLGAISNVAGQNNWAGPVALGSPVPNYSAPAMGAAVNTSLIFSELISNGSGQIPPPPNFVLTKVDAGTVVFNDANTYTKATVVAAGILDIRDSQALGANGGAGTTVDSGATLELEVDNNSFPNYYPDPHGRDLTNDSLVGQTGNGPQLGLKILTNITLNGTGVNGTLGALYSFTGINLWDGTIALATSPTAIRVDPDPHPSTDNTYFTHDYSLTVNSSISGAQLEKIGQGQMISTVDNTYTGGTLIEAGWITIETPNGLGGRLVVGDTVQPTTQVFANAALFLKPLTTSMNLVDNLILSGTGISYPSTAFALISGKGALMNLSGDNTLGTALLAGASGPTTEGSTIQLNGVAGIGVEALGPLPMSNLTITAPIADANGNPGGGITKFGSLRLTLQGPGTYSGPVDVREGVLRVENNTALGQAITGLGTLTSPIGYNTTPTTVETGAGLELGAGIAVDNGGMGDGIEVDNEKLNLFSPGAQVAVGGQPGPAYTFTLTYTDPVTGQSTTTAPLQSLLQATGGTQTIDSVQNAINALLAAADPGGSAVVASTDQSTYMNNGQKVLAGQVYTFTFGGNLTQYDPSTFLSANGTQGVSVTVNGQISSLKNLSDDVAKVSISDPYMSGSGGTFTMTYTNNSTNKPFSTTLPYGSTVAAVQSALRALLALPGADPNGTATVTQAGVVTTNAPGNPVNVANNQSQEANVYTITFGGNLVGVDPASFFSTTGGGPVQVAFLPTAPTGTVTLAYNGVAAPSFSYNPGTTYTAFQTYLQKMVPFPSNTTVTVSPTSPNGGPFLVTLSANADTSLLTVAAGTAQINGVFVTTGVNQSADNLWRGPVVLAANSAIDVAYDSRLTILGNISNNTAIAGFNKVGLGELALGGSNSYSGQTNINQGIVTLESSNALGSPTGQGAVVANGATLQLQGNITTGNEPLTLEGSGLGQAPTNIPVQWFNTGPAPTNNGETGGNMTVSGQVTGVVTDPTDPNVIYVSTAGGGAWKSIDDGKTWNPLFDNSSEVQVTVIGSNFGVATFSLNFNGASATLPLGATAAQVQAALDALPTIGGVGGSVSVSETAITLPAPGGDIYTIDYGGSLSATNPPPMTAGGSSLTPGYPQITNINPTIFTGAIAVAPSDPRVIYLGTGLTYEQPDSFYGTGVYRSLDSGRTWSLLTDPNPNILHLASQSNLPNPLYGLSVSSIAVDPFNSLIIYVATSDENIANEPPVFPASVAGVYRFDGSANGNDSWFNLTSVTSTTRSTLVGQFGSIPGNPGPDDDFRMSFPQLPQPAFWSDVAIVYSDQANLGRPQPFWTPTVYASLGNIEGTQSNAVYRCPDPGSDAPVWYVGFPGTPVDQQETIMVPAGVTFNLSYSAGYPYVPSGAGATYFSFSTPPGVIQNLLNTTPGVLPPGGAVTVVVQSADPTQTTYLVTFVGTLSDSPQPKFLHIDLNGVVTITITQPGAGADSRTDEFPAGIWDPPFTPRNGNIKFAAELPPRDTNANQVVIYAAIAAPAVGPGTNAPWQPFGNGSGFDIEESTNGGGGGVGPIVPFTTALPWVSVVVPGPPQSPDTNYTANLGFYNLTLALDPTNSQHVLVAGYGQPLVTGPWETTNSGQSWTDLGVDFNGNSPHTSYHDSTFDSKGDILFGTDGGVYLLTAFGTARTWEDLNGNLATAQVNYVAAAPDNPNLAIVASQGNGTEVYSGSQAYQTTDPIETPTSQFFDLDGEDVAFDTINTVNPGSLAAFHILENPGQPSTLVESTDAGQTWTVNTAYPGSDPRIDPIPPFVIDSVNPDRILIGGSPPELPFPPPVPDNSLLESLDEGQTFTSLTSPLLDVTAIGAATYQGPFVLDPGFLQVKDQGANTYDPDTIYITDGATLEVTKNHGLTWLDRTPVLPATAVIQKIAVDASDRDTAYLVVSSFTTPGASQIWRTLDAGQHWVNITTGALAPASAPFGMPIYSIVVDPRHAAGVSADVYVGTDNGVYLSPGGASLPANVNSQSGFNTWVRFGAGMPDVSVHDLELDQSINMLSAGTYGRSMYQLFLTGNQEALSTTNVPIPKSLPTVQSMTFTLNNYLSVIPGDLVTITGGGYTLHGTVFSYDSEAEQLVVNFNAAGLGNGAGQGPFNSWTILVNHGALYAISGSSVWAGPVTLAGDTTVGANGTQLGSQVLQNGVAPAQINIAGTVADQQPVDTLTFTNPPQSVTLSYNGVSAAGALSYVSGTTDSEAIQNYLNTIPALSAPGAITVAPNGSVPDSFTITFAGALDRTLLASSDPTVTITTGAKLTKIGEGNVIFSGSNTYGGQTDIQEGALIVHNPQALGAAGLPQNTTSDTIVESGTALVLDADLANETVELFGDGINFNGINLGALINGANNNTFSGTLVLETFTTIGVNSASTLTIGTEAGLPGTGTIVDGPGANNQWVKESTGTLILNTPNTGFTGLVTVDRGVLQIQDDQALGNAGNNKGTSVLNGAQLQLQAPPTGVPLVVTGESLTLSGTGIDNTGALLDEGGNNSWAGPVYLAGNSPPPPLPAPPPPPGSVAIGVKNAGDILTINAAVGNTGGSFGLTKVGPGRLTLTSADTYNGPSGYTTVVQAGSLRIQNAAGLGAPTLGTQVQVGADLEIDGDPTDILTFTNPPQSVILSYNGVPASAPLNYVSGVTSVTNILNYLNTIPGLSALGAGSVVVNNTGANPPADSFVITFPSPLDPTLLTSSTTAVTITTGATGAGINVVGDNLYLNGNGLAGAGALLNVTGQNTWSATAGDLLSFAASGNVVLAYNDVAVPGIPGPGNPTGALSFVSTTTTAANIQAYLNTSLALSGVTVTGNGPFTVNFPAGLNPALLTVMSGAAQIQNGNVTLQTTPLTQTSAAVSNVTIGANAGTQLTIASNVQDPTPVPVPAASITKAGLGTVVFPNANTYLGTTIVNSGILQIQNGGSLGGAGSPEVETITILGANGTFQLQFTNNYNITSTTVPININSLTLTQDIQNALNALPNITGPTVGGYVTVTQGAYPNSNVYTVTFGGDLAIQKQGQLAPVNISNAGLSVLTAIVNDGPEGTVVNNGASLQLAAGPAGPFIVSNEFLTLNGGGYNNKGALENVNGSNTWETSSTDVVASTTDVVAFSASSGTVNLVYNNIALGSFTYSTATTPGQFMNYLLNPNGDPLDLTGNISVSGAAGGPFVVTFSNGANPNFLVAATTAPGPVQITDTVTLDYNGASLGNFAFSPTATPAQFLSYLSANANLNGNVTVGGANGGPFVVNFNNGANPLFLTADASAAGLVQITTPLSTLVLGSNANIAVDNSADTLSIITAISDGIPSSGFTLTKVGSGALTLESTNTYTGLTTVNGGTLNLDNANNAQALDGPLTINRGATVQWDESNQVPSAAPITDDGSLYLNGFTQTIGPLTMVDGYAETGAGGVLTINPDMNGVSLNMTGSEILIDQGGSVNLMGNVTATSDNPAVTPFTNGDSLIAGPGTLAEGPATRTFNVTLGGFAPADLDISAPISGSAASVGLIKTGAGRLEIDSNNNTYQGMTTVLAGDLQVDGTIGDVTVNALNGFTASLSGTGHVATIFMGPGGGTIDPGDNGSLNPVGTLTSTPLVADGAADILNAQTTLDFDLPLADPAAQHDRFIVNGGLTLGGATLIGTIGTNIAIFSQFTIIQTTGAFKVTPKFAEPDLPGTVFINGRKFGVAYNNQSVVLTLEKADVAVSVVSSLNPSVYGQDVVYTATIKPLIGTGTIPPADTVTFHFYNTALGINYSLTTHVTGNQATFDPQKANNVALPVGVYSLDVTFGGDANFFNPAGTGDIQEFSTGITLGANPTSIVLGPDGNLWFTETGANKIGTINFKGVVTEYGTGISANAGLSGITVGTDGNLWFTEQTADKIGKITLAGAVTEYSLGITANSGPANITSGPDGALWFTEENASQIGRITTAGAITEYSAGITENSQPYGIVAGPDTNLWFTEVSGNKIGKISLGGAVTEYSTGITSGSSPQSITVGPDGNLWFTESAGNRIGKITTAGTVTEYNTGISSGSGPFGIAKGPDNNLWFTEANGNRIGKITPSGTVTEYSAGLTANSDPLGITAGPDGNIWFAENNASQIGHITPTLVTQVENLNPTSLVVSIPTLPSPQPVYAQPITVSVTITPQTAPTVPQATLPSGTASFTVDGTLQMPLSPVNAAGVATLTLDGAGGPYLSVGVHHISVTYNSDGKYGASSTVNDYLLTISKDNTTVVVSASSNPAPAVYDQTVALTATVKAAVGAGLPTGTVRFYDGIPSPSDQIGSAVSLNSSTGLAVTSTTFSVATHTITAVYSGDSDYNLGNTPPNGIGTLMYPVGQDNTFVAITPIGNLVYGTPATLTATVTPAVGAGQPTGTVKFYDGAPGAATFIGQGTINAATGMATTTTPALPVENNLKIYALYQGDTNYTKDFLDGGPNPSTNGVGLLTGVVVNQANTTVVVSAVPTSIYGQTVSLTAKVSPATGTGQPTGNVNFYDGTPAAATFLGTGTITASSGIATLVTAAPKFLPVSSNLTIYALYQGDSNYTTDYIDNGATMAPNGVGTVSGVVVNKDNTSVTISAIPTSVYGQAETLTATVHAAVGAGLPTGTVTFYDGLPSAGTLLGTGSIANPANGIATFTAGGPAFLAAGNITIYGLYQGDINYTQDFLDSGLGNATNGVGMTTTTVTKANTVVTLAAIPSSTYGLPVALTATVTAAVGAGLPTGSVNFYSSTPSALTLLGTGTITPATGVATFTTMSTNPLPVGAGQTLYALYEGDSNYTKDFLDSGLGTAANGVGTGPYTVGMASTTVSLSAGSPNPSSVGTPVTFNATVSSGGLNPTSGIVDFIIDGNNLPANHRSLGGTNVAIFTINSLTFGPHTITAQYEGNSDYQASNISGSQTQSVLSKATIGIVPDASSYVYGQAANITANVSGPNGTPTGTVQFQEDGGTLSAAQNLSSGTYVFSNVNLGGVANHTITIYYSGNASYAPNQQSTTINVGQAGTATGLSALPSSGLVYGQVVTFTAPVTVTGLSTAAAPSTGNVNFYYTPTAGGTTTQLGTAQAVNGSGIATLMIAPTALTVGTSYTISAAYQGSTNYAVSATPGTIINFVVGKAGSQTTPNVTWSGGAANPVYGQTVNISATVSGLAPSTAAPPTTGTVSFFDNGNALGTAQSVNSSSVASLPAMALPVGTNNITAVYNGNGNFGITQAANEMTFSVMVNPATPNIKVSANPAAILSGSLATFTAIISAQSPGSGVPTNGTVTFWQGAVGGTQIGTTQNVTSGTVSVSTSSLAAGLYTIVAQYLPPSLPTVANFTTGTGTLTNFQVSQSNHVGNRIITVNTTLTVNMAQATGYAVQQAGTEAWFLLQNHGLYEAPNGFLQNSAGVGAQEKWFKGTKDQNGNTNIGANGNPTQYWYYILPNGNFYFWNGGSGLNGTLLATVDPIYYYFPNMIANASQDTYGYAISQALALHAPTTYWKAPGDFWQNYDGLQERWLQGTGGVWYYITPNGSFYNGSNVLLAQLDPMYYNEPNRLYAALPNQIVANTPTVANPVLTVTPAHDFVGQWLIQLTTINTGQQPVVEQFSVTVVEPLPTLAPIDYITLSHAAASSTTVTLSGSDPNGDPVNYPLTYAANTGTQGYAIETAYGLHFAGGYYQNSFGANLQEIWYKGNTNQYGNPWYFLTPNGSLYAWNNGAGVSNQLSAQTLIASLDPVYYQNPSLLYSSLGGGTDLTYVLKQTLGLHTATVNGVPNLYTNFYGTGESWLQGSGGAWYLVYPDGTVYKWTGTAVKTNNTLVATLPANANSAITANSLANASLGQFSTQLNGNALTVTPASTYIGDIWVLAGVTDDGNYTLKPGNNRFVWRYFKITVTA